VVDGQDLGTVVTLSGGTAISPSTTLLGAGSNTIEADYSGDSNYAKNSGDYTQVVSQAPLGIVPNNLSRPIGQPNPPLTYYFTGFVNGDTASTSNITGAADLATTATTSSPEGNYPITVTSAGTLAAPNYDFPSADFGMGTLTVGLGTVNVIVGSSHPNSTYGQLVIFTVRVTASSGGPIPQGTVQFLVNGKDLGSAVKLSRGTASSVGTTLLAVGNNAIEADYSGDGNYSKNSGYYTQIVNKATLTLVADNQQMNHYDPVPTLTYHYTGFVNGDNANNSGITASISVSTTATSNSAAGYYPITATVNSFSAPNYVVGTTQAGTLTVKPKVMDVRVQVDKSSMSLISLNRDLPFIDIKAIDVIFSDNVNVSSSMLSVSGVNVKNYAFSSFGYDSNTFEATWTLSSAIAIDRLMLSLSGEAAPPVSGSGPNIAANPFNDGFAVLPGDVDGDRVVSKADLAIVNKDMKRHKYSIWADVNGDGVVNMKDYNAVKKRLGTRLR
jgi:hypothetical protein